MAYPATWTQNGVIGTPLLVGENAEDYTDGRQTYKLSKKVGSIKLVLKSVDSGANWVALALTSGYTINTTTNEITFVTTLGAQDLFQVFYTTHTSMAEPTVNSEVIDVAIGDVFAVNSAYTNRGNYLNQSLIGKVGTTASTPRFIDGNKEYTIRTWLDNVINDSFGVVHSAVSVEVNTNAPTVKTFPYITVENGRYVMNLVFKEMKYDLTWGDDAKFNIVDNVSTTTDDNGKTILIGIKKISLPYFRKNK